MVFPVMLVLSIGTLLFASLPSRGIMSEVHASGQLSESSVFAHPDRIKVETAEKPEKSQDEGLDSLGSKPSYYASSAEQKKGKVPLALARRLARSSFSADVDNSIYQQYFPRTNGAPDQELRQLNETSELNHSE
jgi:hypothetical protein